MKRKQACDADQTDWVSGIGYELHGQPPRVNDLPSRMAGVRRRFWICDSYANDVFEAVVIQTFILAEV